MRSDFRGERDDQALALSRFLDGEPSPSFGPSICLMIATHPTTPPFTSLTGDKDMETWIRFPPFRICVASQGGILSSRLRFSEILLISSGCSGAASIYLERPSTSPAE